MYDAHHIAGDRYCVLDGNGHIVSDDDLEYGQAHRMAEELNEAANAADLIVTLDRAHVGIRPDTDAGRDWLEKNVQAEGWQWLGRVLYVGYYAANNILEAATGDGLKLREG